MDSVRRCYKFSPYHIEMVSDGSQTNMLLTKVEPISDSASVIIDFKKENKPATQHPGE